MESANEYSRDWLTDHADWPHLTSPHWWWRHKPWLQTRNNPQRDAHCSSVNSFLILWALQPLFFYWAASPRATFCQFSSYSSNRFHYEAASTGTEDGLLIVQDDDSMTTRCFSYFMNQLKGIKKWKLHLPSNVTNEYINELTCCCCWLIWLRKSDAIEVLGIDDWSLLTTEEVDDEVLWFMADEL